MQPELGIVNGTSPSPAKSGAGTGAAAAFGFEKRMVVAETVRATVLFVDLRGYTGLAERLPPATVANLLEEFFDVLASATERHGGQIFYMVGDGMMAGFGMRDPAADGARDALAAAEAMLKGFSPVVARWHSDLAVETGIGIGLHLGDVARCLHGPPERRTHTLVGDTVNVAARLCGRARAGEVLFSSTVAASLQAGKPAGEATADAIPWIHLPQFALRGRTRPLDIWCMPAARRVRF
jgi:adenylate cyclase